MRIKYHTNIKYYETLTFYFINLKYKTSSIYKYKIQENIKNHKNKLLSDSPIIHL